MWKQCKGVYLLGTAMFFWMTNLFAEGPDTLWTRTYGGDTTDVGFSVQQTSDSGYIIAGVTISFGAGKDDVYLIKTDKNGNILWTRTYGGKENDRGYSVHQTSDGGYIIVGATSSFGAGNYDVYLIKTDGKGDTLWTKTYGGGGGDVGYSVQQTSDGGYIITGWTKSFTGGGDVYLVKTDATGDTLWTKIYGGTGNVGYSVEQTSDGGYIIAGTTEALSGDVYLIKTDVKGDTLWTKTYGIDGDIFYGDIGYSIQQTTDGGYIIAGKAETKSFSARTSYIYLIKTDVNGDAIWTKTYEGTGGYSIQKTSDGRYIIAGASNGDVYLIKIDSEGNILWTRRYGEQHNNVGFSVQQTFDGGYIIAGETGSLSPGSYDVYLIKTKPDPAGIEENEKCKVQNAKLDVYPNPFSEKTTVRYTIPDAGYKPQDFSLIIYDVSGRAVRDLTNNLVSCIRNHVSAIIWDGRDNAGEKVSSGIYFLRFEVDSIRDRRSHGARRYNATKKLLIMR